MSKNIKLNDTDYTGISTVQLPTTNGGTASFKDTDEITTPSGSKTITENGTHDVTNFAKAIVNVVASSVTSEMESGEFTPEANTQLITIDINSAKTYLVLYTENQNLETLGQYGMVSLFSKNGLFKVEGHVNYSGSNFQGQYTPAKAYSNEGETGAGKLGYCNFYDDHIAIYSRGSNNSNECFIAGVVYKWISW